MATPTLTKTQRKLIAQMFWNGGIADGSHDWKPVTMTALETKELVESTAKGWELTEDGLNAYANRTKEW